MITVCPFLINLYPTMPSKPTKSISIQLASKIGKQQLYSSFIGALGIYIQELLINRIYYLINRRIMTMKKKSDLTTIFDDLRNEDSKKRLAAILEIKELAAALGPSKVRSDLIPFLSQFVDDQENIVLQLLSQLQNFTPLLGGQEHQKCLIPLLIAFCKTDEKKSGFKACNLMQRILASNKDLASEAAKKLMKTDMVVAKECSAMMIPGIITAHQSLEGAMLQLYASLILGENPQTKIICAKYLHVHIDSIKDLMKVVKVKEEVGKLLDNLYNQGDQLTKIYAMKALIDYYDVNPNSSLTKFKNLSIYNSWRINIKLCEYIDLIVSKCTKPHFKLIFEGSLMKFITSNQPELRAASCKTLSALTKTMTEEQQKSKLLPCIKKLSSDSVDYVKVELSKNIVSLCGSVSGEIMNEWLLPIIFGFIKDTNSEISLGVMRSFDFLATRMSKDILEDKIIKPLLQQLQTDNWRIKCQIIDILKTFITTPTFLNQSVLKALFSLTDDKIDAVRVKINELIILIVNNNSKDWCDQFIIPKISQMKENANYIKKQNLLDIIEKTAANVSEKSLVEVYQNTIITCLSDKVNNVKIKSIQVLKSNNKLSNVVAQKQLAKLKQDKDVEIREMIKKLR